MHTIQPSTLQPVDINEITFTFILKLQRISQAGKYSFLNILQLFAKLHKIVPT
jgi:hypothetical protein